MLKHWTRCVLTVAFVVAAASAFAQPLATGTLQGDVKDQSGAVLPGVTLTLTSEDRGFVRTTVSDANGTYVFPAVPIGRYTVSATLQGFRTEQVTGNLVETDKSTIVPLALSVGAVTETVQVVGDIPIVTPTNTAANTRLRNDEFEKLAIGRSYQALIGTVPGVVGQGNVNALGALSSNNIFVIDSVDTTDTTTGTFGTNLNYEAIQEISVYTSGVSAEYGRGQGAIVHVITKSGTNRYEGSGKYIFTNDNWDAQNSTKSEVTGASLARVKFDKVNPVYTFTGGGPIKRDRAWVFGTWELRKNTTAQRQTVGQIPEDYQQSTRDKFANIRATAQLFPGHTVWVKYFRSPTNGFVVDYWTNRAGEREALTLQDQTAKNWAGQWSGVLKDNWSMEAAIATYSGQLYVTPYELSSRLGGAPILSYAENKYYNGATFDGYTDRPRQQFNVSSNWFLAPGGRTHDVKVGFDFQNVESRAEFKYPNAQWFGYNTYNQATGTGDPDERDDFLTGPSVSKGTISAIFARDKFKVTNRVFVEAGLRFEHQTGKSDVGVLTIDTNVIAPRLSGNYDVSGDGKSLIAVSFGRYYQAVIQDFSDGFAQVPQQENFDVYLWNGSSWVFSNQVRVGGNDFMPNLDLKPSHMDEFSAGFQRQFGRTMGAGIRFITREWSNLIDDLQTFRPDGSINRTVANYDAADRQYRGLQLSVERRYSNNWYLQGSYTFSRTTGNHFGDTFTALGDFLDATCFSSLDAGIGAGGRIACAEVANGANKTGRPIYDRPHNFKLNGAYTWPIRSVNVTVGAVTEFISKRRYEKRRPMTVLRPGTNTNSGQTLTYFYEPLGSFQLAGLQNFVDFSTEAVWRIAGTHQAGFKAEIFNLTNNEEKIINNNTAWCASTATAACQTAVNNFGKAVARTAFLTPRQYRFSLLYRF